MNSKVLNPSEAVGLIKDNSTIVVEASGGGLVEPDSILKALETKYIEKGHPNKLTLISATGFGDGKEKGLCRFAHSGFFKRVIAGHYGWAPGLEKLISNNEIEAYNLPQGVISMLIRESAGKRPSLLTKVGLNTFVDPRIEGGKLNSKTVKDIVKVINIDGEEYLFYKAFTIDVAIIRGTTADEDGNISMEQEAAKLGVLSAAQAAHNNNGIVIVQVKRLARRGTLNSRQVIIPGILVDCVVPIPEQWQTYAGEYNPSFSGEIRTLVQIPGSNLTERKVIARRAAQHLKANAVINLGFGISSDVSLIAAEEGCINKFTFTVEQGLVGGIPANGNIFGVSYNPIAILDQSYQFDFYQGGGLDIAFLGMAQVDKQGNVNVSKFGKKLAGCGGFIDISQNTKEVVFCGTFTAAGLYVKIDNGKIIIINEGKICKFCKSVEQISFSVVNAKKSGQKVTYITERAVFELEEKGITLTEIAPGIDLEKDILGQMDFKPLIRKPLTVMDSRLFRSAKIGLKV